MLRSLLGDSYLNSTLPVTLPTFDHFHHEFHRFISADDQRSHNLHKFAKLARQRSKIYKEVSCVLLDQMAEFSQTTGNDFLITRDVSRVSWWLSWSSIICSYSALCLALYLLYRVSMLTSVLTLVRPAAAAGFSTIFPKSLSFGSDNDARLPTLSANQSFFFSLTSLQYSI